MPDIPICGANGEWDWRGVAHTFATMLYPSDPDARANEAARIQTAVAAQLNRHGTLDGDTVLRAANVAPPGRQEWSDGVFAGEQLKLLYILQHEAPSKAGLENARKLIEQNAGNYWGAKRRTLRDAWRKMCPVAHFWSAYSLRGFHLGEGDDFATFHLEAEMLRQFATSFYLRRDKRYLVEAEKTWRAPRHWRVTGPSGLEVAAKIPAYTLGDEALAKLSPQTKAAK